MGVLIGDAVDSHRDVQAAWDGVLEAVAPLRRSSAGWMSARIGRLSAGIGGGCEHCGTKRECSTLLLNGPGIRWLFATLLFRHPSQSQQVASRVQGLDVNFLRSVARCRGYMNVLSNVTTR